MILSLEINGNRIQDFKTPENNEITGYLTGK